MNEVNVAFDKTTAIAIAAARDKLLDGLTPLPVFAAAAGRTLRSGQKWAAQGMPVVYIGCAPYVQIAVARDWLLARKHPRRHYK